jgi:hypothetical protein
MKIPAKGLFGYFQSIWIGGDWYGLKEILTYQGLKPPQSPSIHMDWGRTEQALRGPGVAQPEFEKTSQFMFQALIFL